MTDHIVETSWQLVDMTKVITIAEDGKDKDEQMSAPIVHG